MKAALPLLAAPLALAACVPAAKAPPASAPAPPVAAARPAPAPPRPVTSSVPQAAAFDSWMDAPATPGAWRFAPAARGSQAAFAGSGGAEFALSCDAEDRSVTLSRFGSARAPSGITIRSETATRSLPVTQGGGGAAPSLSARLAANDPLLDAMALSKGRFAVEAEGLPTLYLPSWAEVSRVIEDCRG